MTRWVMAAVIAGLLAAGSAPRHGAARADPGVEAAIWHAAGIVPLPRSLRAPPFRLDDLAGKPVDLERLRGRLVMLYFWATW